MIQTLRRQFIWIAALSMGIIFLLMLISVNVFMTVSMKEDSYNILKRVADGDGHMERPAAQAGEAFKNGKTYDPARMTRISDIKRTFAIRVDHDGKIIDLVDNGSSSFTKEEMEKLAEQVLASEHDDGTIQNHSYLVKDKSYGKIIAFVDCTHEINHMLRLLYICVISGGIGICILFLAVIRLSYWAVRPIEEGFARQKQFVADAGHELKTPLAVVSANVSVLETMYGKNQWTEYIQADIGRMNRLIQELLRLARMEHPQLNLSMEEIRFDVMVKEILMSYESVAFEQGKQFGYEVEEGLTYHGNRDSMTQMIHIFVDNAFKYAGPGGEVRVTVKRKKKRICVELYNSGSGISKEGEKHIFERFYREEGSHSHETGGYGLGLSIAKTILDYHHGKVLVKSDETSYVTFLIML